MMRRSPVVVVKKEKENKCNKIKQKQFRLTSEGSGRDFRRFRRTSEGSGEIKQIKDQQNKYFRRTSEGSGGLPAFRIPRPE
jgi:hypothetical protein